MGIGGWGVVLKDWYKKVSEKAAGGLGASWQEHGRPSEGLRDRKA